MLRAMKTLTVPPHVVMGGVFLALFLASLNQTMVSTALPSIVAEMGSLELYSWVFTAYMLTSTIAVPILGKISDLYGRRQIFLWGIAAFVMGSWLAGLAQTMSQLVALRALQGLGAGAIFPMAFATVGDLYPPQERGRIQGLIGVAFAASSLIGPLAGGWLTDWLGWKWAFWSNVPVGLLAWGYVAATLPPGPVVHQTVRVDVWGAVCLSACLTPLLLWVSLGGKQLAWFGPVGLALITVSALAGWFFVQIERRASEPIIDFKLFENHTFSVVAMASVLSGIVLFGDTMFLPLLAQGLLGLSPTSAGALLTPFMLGMVSGSTLSGHLSARWHQSHPLAVGGLALATVGATGLLMTAMLTPHALWTGLTVALVGVGLGATFPIFLLMAQNAVPPSQLGSATSLVQFFRSVGGTVGVALLGALLAAQFETHLLAQLPAGGGSVPSVRDFLSPGGMAGLPPAIALAVTESLRYALGWVFALSACSAASAWWISRRLARPEPSPQGDFPLERAS